MSVPKTYLWYLKRARYNDFYSKFPKQGCYVIATTTNPPKKVADFLTKADLEGDELVLFNILESNRPISSNQFENVDKTASVFTNMNFKNVEEISSKLYAVTNSDGNVLPLIQMDVQKIKRTLGMQMLKYIQDTSSSTHFERMKIEKKDLGDNEKKAALEKLLEDSGGKDILNDKVTRSLVLVVEFPDNIKTVVETMASARVSSRTGTISASRAARIKLAVAADHVNGTPFTASKALIAGESASHPLVAAVMGLRIGASSYAVNRVLDMAPSAHHAVNEVEEAMKMVAAHPHDVVSVYPCGVATRLLDNDTDGAVTEALSRVF